MTERNYEEKYKEQRCEYEAIIKKLERKRQESKVNIHWNNGYSEEYTYIEIRIQEFILWIKSENGKEHIISMENVRRISKSN
ncbi:hypothetical protein LJB90_03690 [Eubacteriales bacterium OttesenSCG-928-G02]|nr:hypothetical protein [Eubacteriales bacterium OttesenSCG-928-G02]